MANESTSTSINDFSQSYFISEFVMATLAEHALPMSWCKEFDLRGKESAGVQVGYLDSVFGSANDYGAGVDTEYNATEGTALSNTQIASSSYQATASEYGIAVELTDNVQEDSISGVDILDKIQGHQQRALALAWTSDFCTLFNSLSNSVGSAGSDFTVAQALAAQVGPRKRGALADDGMVNVWSNEQVDNIEAALTATNAAAAVYAPAADRLLGIDIGPNNGMGAGRQVMTFRGNPVHATGMNIQVNTAGNDVGATFVPDGPSNGPYATFGNIVKRAPRLELDRSAKGRSTDLVLTMRMAPFELQDGSGSGIVTDAP